MGDLNGVRGDTNVYDVRVIRRNAPVNLSGCKMWFTAKDDKDDLDVDAVIALDNQSHPLQIVLTQPTAGRAQISLVPGDTVDLINNAFYYDIQLLEESGIVTTIANGILHLEDDVTKTYA